MFLATFAYAIVVIVVEGSSSSASVLRLAVTLGVLFVLASLVIFVVYVTATMRLLQVSWVVTAVADETRRDVGRNRPVAACVLQFLAKVGEYLPIGAAVVAVHDGDGPPDDAVRGCVHLGRSRTMYQDPLYRIRQLVDVASQALSPAINQPTTAVVVVDRLEELLLRIGRRPQPTGFFVETNHVVRLVNPEPTWAETVDLAFTEIAIYGASSPAVTRRLAAAYDRLHRLIPFDLRVDVARHITLLKPLANAAIQPDHAMATPALIHGDSVNRMPVSKPARVCGWGRATPSRGDGHARKNEDDSAPAYEVTTGACECPVGRLIGLWAPRQPSVVGSSPLVTRRPARGRQRAMPVPLASLGIGRRPARLRSGWQRFPLCMPTGRPARTMTLPLR
jgi:hypothetical protein